MIGQTIHNIKEITSTKIKERNDDDGVFYSIDIIIKLESGELLDITLYSKTREGLKVKLKESVWA